MGLSITGYLRGIKLICIDLHKTEINAWSPDSQQKSSDFKIQTYDPLIKIHYQPGDEDECCVWLGLVGWGLYKNTVSRLEAKV